MALVAFGLRPAQAQTVEGAMKRWQPVALTFAGPQRAENAATFRDYRFDLLLTSPSGKERVVPGFFAADGDAANSSARSGNRWRVRLLPLEEGSYEYGVRFRCGEYVAVKSPASGTACGFDGTSGTFTVGAEEADASGFDAKGLLSQEAGTRFLRFADGDLFIKGGADSPEDLLAYSGFDGTPESEHTTAYDPHLADWTSGDPTWGSGRGKELIGAINYLAAEGMNAISFIPMNVAGDGDNVWPWTDRGARFTYDVSKLAQWEVVLRHATRQGLFLHFKTQETEHDSLLGGLTAEGELKPERALYYRELVARFGHHPALNWNLGEENTNSDAERKAFAAYFKALDSHDHPVVVHTYPGDKTAVYEPLLGGAPFDGPSIQLGSANDAEAWTAGREWLSRSRQHGDQWVCSGDEPGNASDGVYEGEGGPDDGNLPASRAVMYATYLAGCYGTEWYFGYDHPDDDLGLDDFRSRDTWWDQVRVALDVVRDFYEATDPAEGTAHRDIEDGYVIEGTSADGTAQALVYLHDGRVAFGTSYERVVYTNPRTGTRTEAQPVGSGGLEAPFSGDAVALLSGGH